MHHHTTYRGRCHTKKLNDSKSKLPPAEREKRQARKKLEKLFPNHISHLCQHFLAIKGIPFINAGAGREARRS